MTLVNLILMKEVRCGEDGRAVIRLDTDGALSYDDFEVLKVPPVLVRYTENSKPTIQMNHCENRPPEVNALLIGDSKILGEIRPASYCRIKTI